MAKCNAAETEVATAWAKYKATHDMWRATWDKIDYAEIDYTIACDEHADARVKARAAILSIFKNTGATKAGVDCAKAEIAAAKAESAAAKAKLDTAEAKLYAAVTKLEPDAKLKFSGVKSKYSQAQLKALAAATWAKVELAQAEFTAAFNYRVAVEAEVKAAWFKYNANARLIAAKAEVSAAHTKLRYFEDKLDPDARAKYDAVNDAKAEARSRWLNARKVKFDDDGNSVYGDDEDYDDYD